MRLSSLELQMGLDALVTRLEVNVRDGLYVGFRGLGGIHVPDWKQLWVTDKLGKNSNDFLVQQQTQANLDRVKRKVRENKFISGFKTRLKRAYWWIYQLYCPVRLRDKLPKDFLRGHYTPQARWQLTAPGQMATLDDEIIKALQAKKRIDEQLTTLRSDIAETRSKGYATRVWNDLNELFGTYPGSDFEVFEAGAQEMATLRPLDHSILERRSAIADEITELNASSPLNLNYAPITDNDRSHVLRLEAPNTDFISKTRTPSIDELLGMKWMFLDIEVPYWKYDNPKVRWIGMKFWDGKKTISEIYTVNDVGTEEVRDYTIHRFDTTEEMIKAFTERTNELDPDIMSTYNTRYDLIKLRESCAGYPVDERGKDPVFDANTPFFERIGVRGRLVIDPMRWQKIAKSYDPNAKLEMALGKKKSITYDQMEVLETEDPLRVATYLTEDVDGLFSIFERDEFRKNLEDALFISGKFGVGLERILHSPNRINDAQEKEYFTAVGLYRDKVPPHRRETDSDKRDQAARGLFTKQVTEKGLPPGEKKGLSRDVYKVFIPIGDMLQEAVAKNFPKANALYEYMDEHRDDKQRLFFLEQYANALARWMITDYGRYLKETSKLDKLTKDLDKDEFEDYYHEFRAHVEISDSIAFNAWDNGKLRVSAIDDLLPDQIRTYLANNSIDLGDFAKMLNQRSDVKWSARNFVGNYDVFPSRQYFDVEKRRQPEDVVVFEEILQQKFGEINDFLEQNGLDIVAREGNYLYLTGDRYALEREDAPVVLVDEIPALFNADNLYYMKHGYYSHLKTKDDPGFHQCLFEMNSFRGILDALLASQNREAVARYRNAGEQLTSGDISTNEFLFYNNSERRYFAFTADSENESGKTHFVKEKRFAKGDIYSDNTTGLEYFLAEENGEEIKVFVIDPSTLIIDTEQYEARFHQKAKKMLKPIFPDDQLDLF